MQCISQNCESASQKKTLQSAVLLGAKYTLSHQELYSAVSTIGRAQRSLNQGSEVGGVSITTGPVNSLQVFQIPIPVTMNSAGSKILVHVGGRLSQGGHNNVYITLENETTILDSSCYTASRLKGN